MDDPEKKLDADRSAEEIAWDEEFSDTKRDDDLTSTLGDLARLAIQVPAAIVQMPVNMLPQDTRRHARAAVREGFLAVRSLLSAIGDGIEEMLAEPAERQGAMSVRSGPPGTWGTAPSEQSPFKPITTGKVRRIEVSDEAPVRIEATGPAVTDEEGEEREGRGLRADIDY